MFCLITGAGLILPRTVSAANGIPQPDHVVILMLENHAYNQIIANTAAPYINELVFRSANLMEYYALTHPSQPNYLMLFSGDNQGVTSGNLPSGTPWTTPNLGGSMLNAGHTFAAYSEDIPTIGSTVASSGAYARKHCPWVNWQGNGLNQIPDTLSMSMEEFPTDYNLLPDLSFVIPNQNNDMHNGSDPARIATGDAWVYDNLKSYIDWTQNNNSLFILVFDEDNFTTVNKVMCLFIGPMVRQGNYFMKGYDHYDLLHTLEDMFDLPYAGNSINAQSIDEIWFSTVDVPALDRNIDKAIVFPNPVSDFSMIRFSEELLMNDDQMHFFLIDVNGRIVSDEIIQVIPGIKSYAFRKDYLPGGIYSFLVRNERTIFGSGKVILN